MGIDRKIYKLPFQPNRPCGWVCPACNKSIFKIKDDTFHSELTRSSRNAQSSDDWSPDWDDYVYSCLLECTNPSCKEIVSSSGVGFVDNDTEDDIDGNPSRVLSVFYTPKYFSPNLKIFNYPKKTPTEVKDELENSFALFFCDPSSAGNHIRITLEKLLTHLGIKRFRDRAGKRVFLNLHSRIELLPNKYDDIQDLFKAIKWLGNAGSHSGKQVTSDDILDAYELMEELLAEVFSHRSKKVKSLAKQINKKKGPKKSK